MHTFQTISSAIRVRSCICSAGWESSESGLHERFSRQSSRLPQEAHLRYWADACSLIHSQIALCFHHFTLCSCACHLSSDPPFLSFVSHSVHTCAFMWILFHTICIFGLVLASLSMCFQCTLFQISLALMLFKYRALWWMLCVLFFFFFFTSDITPFCRYTYMY